VGLTINCKVIYGFDLSLFVVSFSESIDRFEQRLVLVWGFSEGGFGKNDLREEGGGVRSCIYGQ